MLSRELNEKLTRVGPGTPMGELLRRYWYPVAAIVQMDAEPVRKVRLLGVGCAEHREQDDRNGPSTTIRNLEHEVPFWAERLEFHMNLLAHPPRVKKKTESAGTFATILSDNRCRCMGGGE